MQAAVRLPPERRIDVLALVSDHKPMAPLLDELRGLGIAVDTADGLAAARQTFFRSGGHHCLVVGPDVAPGTVRAVVDSLRAIDPELALASFAAGQPKPPTPARNANLSSYHPGSRAGVGAFVRFLHSLPER